MAAFLLRRLGALLLALLAAGVVIFAVLDILPGDPASVMLGLNATPEALHAIRAELGLDQPVITRFFGWFSGFFRGELGLSHAYRVPVAGLIAERLPLTLPLAALALMISASLGITFGAFAATRAKAGQDSLIMAITQVGLAIPNFWLGIVLVLAFAITWPLFPAGGFPGWQNGLWPGVRALILPAIALGLPQAAVIARITRSSVLETLREDYVRTARAKGLSRAEVLRRHVLRNAAVPILTLLGLQAAVLVAGTIIVEAVFALPGLGLLLFQAIGGHDLMLIRSLVMLFVAMVMLITALVDIAVACVDPRARAW